MRAVLAALAWARANKTQIVVHWPRNDPSETLGTFDVGFKELFETEIEEVVMQDPVKAPTWRKVIQPYKGELCIRFCEPEVLEIDQLPLDGWPFQTAWLPGPEVRAEMAKVEFPESKLVGVHIRHALAQNTTPAIGWFINRMRELERGFNCRFFLATDARFVEDEVRSVFPDVICQNKGDYAYDRTGIIRTAADLFLLRRCGWCVGSTGSSYSELAAWMRGASYISGWNRPDWGPNGRWEDSKTPASTAEIKKALYGNE